MAETPPFTTPQQVRVSESTTQGTPLSNFQRRLEAVPPVATDDTPGSDDESGTILTPASTGLKDTAVDAINLVLEEMRALIKASQTTARRPSPSKVSFKDVLAVTKHDTTGLEVKISNNAESFLRGLFAIRRRRKDFPAWSDATFVQLQDNATAPVIKIDLLSDFHKVTSTSVTTLAVAAWNVPLASTLAMDGESNLYIRKSFANFLFASLDESFTRILQNSVPDELWNDGPVIWMHLVFHVFPSAAVFNSSLKASLGSLSVIGTDYPSYITRLREGLILLQQQPNEEIVNGFLVQMSLHPSSIVRSHFEQRGVAFILQSPERKTLNEMMTEADAYHTIAFDKSLPFAKAKASKQDSSSPDIIALATAISANQDALAKVMGMVSEVDGNFTNYRKNQGDKKQKAGFKSQPTWFTTKPDDPKQVKEFNNKKWNWCETCGRWSTTHSTNGDEAQGIAEHKAPSSYKPGVAKGKPTFAKPSTRFKAHKAALAKQKVSLKELIAMRASMATDDS